MKQVKLLLGLGILLIFASIVQADIPKLINFQGILKDSLGNQLAHDTLGVEFKIYDAAVGGSVKWLEADTVITDSNGLFNVVLGSVTPIADTVFNDSLRWLGIKVGSDSEMSPRTQLVSVPYSYVSDTSQAASSAASGWTDEGTVVKLVTSSDSVALGTATPGAKVHILSSETSSGDNIAILSRASNSSTGAAYGGYFETSNLGTGDHAGVYGSAQAASSSTAYGVSGFASNSSTGEVYAGYFTANATGTGAHFGLRSQTSGSGNTYGLYASTNGTGSLNYGVTAGATGAGLQNRGVAGLASNGTSFNYGVFGSATGTNAYAGKFEDAKVGIGNAGTQNIVDGDGDLYVEDELEVDGDVHLDDNTLRVLSAASLVTMGSDTINTQSSKLYVNRTENTASTRTAFYVQAKNSSSGGTTGIFSQATGTPAGTGLHVGVSGIANNTSGQSIGVDAEALGTGTNTGVYATAAGGSINYAVYGEALAGASNYSGYFTGNKVRVATNAGSSTAIGIGDRWRDNAIVAWGTVTSGSILSQEFGVASFVNDSTGVYTITLDASAASSTELVPMAIAEIETPSAPRVININQSAINQFQVFIFNLTGTRVNNDFVFMVTAR